MFCVSPWPLCVHSEYISLLGNPNRYRPLPIRALLDIGQPWSLTVNAYTLWNVTSTQAKAWTQTRSETYEWGFERDCAPMCYLSYLFRIIVYFQILGTLWRLANRKIMQNHVFYIAKYLENFLTKKNIIGSKKSCVIAYRPFLKHKMLLAELSK